MITHVIRLQPGHDLISEIKSHLLEKSIQAGYIAMGIGSLSKLKIRFADQSQHHELNESLEILTLSGSVSLQGCHIHGSFSDSRGAVIGGHINDGCMVRTTAEIIIIELSDWEFQRLPDQKTGYLELTAHKKGKQHAQ